MSSRTILKSVSRIALAALAVAFLASSGAQAADLHPGTVYVMTNQSVNTIAVFDRSADGVLTAMGEVQTGGAGDPVPIGTDPVFDPLASQGALAISGDKDFLLAVNAGSSEISIFEVGGGAGLTLIEHVPSGGIRHIRLAVSGNTVYVLNEGGTEPNVTGFKIQAGGHLTPLDNSTKLLPGGVLSDPAQVGFNFDGDLLVVTEKATNMIDVFPRIEGSLLGDPVTQPSNGPTPFGFAFDKKGHVLVAEAFSGTDSASALSSYQLNRTSPPDSISVSVPNSQTASCWVAVARNKKFAFTSNTGSGTISSYEIGPGGSLALMNGTAASTGIGSSPIDLAFANGSRYLYVVDGAMGVIHGFKVEQNKSLTPIGDTPGIPLGSQGIAAR